MAHVRTRALGPSGIRHSAVQRWIHAEDGRGACCTRRSQDERPRTKNNNNAAAGAELGLNYHDN
eukprot:scaffold83891_cov93-Phaeocystis_antarctica.AAC.1